MRVISSRPLLLHGDDALITNIAQRLQTELSFVPVLFARMMTEHTRSDSGKTQNSQLMNPWWVLGGFVLGCPIKS